MHNSSMMNRIAVIGLGIQTAQCDDKKQFWDIILNDFNCIQEFPLSRYIDTDDFYANLKKTRPQFDRIQGAYLNDMDQFDCQAFGITPTEACLLDPSQKVLLKTTWKALQDAGYTKKRINGSCTGVFIGYNPQAPKFKELISVVKPSYNDISYVGNMPAALAGRISYIFNFRGPAIVINTGRSSSLSAVKYACQNLINNECDLAIAGGINLNVFPDAKDTDNNIGEGAGVVILKKLCHANADGDYIYGIIDDYRNESVFDETIEYYEVCSSGNKANDEMSIVSLEESLSAVTQKEQYCLLGLLNNWGDLGSSGGILSLIKCLLILRHKAIPPCKKMNMPISSPFYSADTSSSRSIKNCAIQCYEANGRESVFILKEAPQYEAHNDISDVFTLSARNNRELKNLIRKVLDDDNMNNQFNDICYSVNVCREHYKYRLAILCRNIKELKEKLCSVLTGKCLNHVFITGKTIQQNINNEHDSRESKLLDVCRAYIEGGNIQWNAFYFNQKRHYVPLPTIEERYKRCWIQPEIKGNIAVPNIPFYKLSWVNKRINQIKDNHIKYNSFVIFKSDDERAHEWISELRKLSKHVIEVEKGERFEIINHDYYIINDCIESYKLLFQELKEQDIDCIIHMMSLNAESSDEDINILNKNLSIGLYSLFHIYKNIEHTRRAALYVLSSKTAKIIKTDLVCPENAALCALGKSIMFESPNLLFKCIDIDLSFQFSHLLYELNHNDEYLVAYRNMDRYSQELDMITQEEIKYDSAPAICKNGTYLITGGLSDIGLKIAKFLSENQQVNIILCGRSPFPLKNQWIELSKDKQYSHIIKKLIAIEKNGSYIYYYQGDIRDLENLMEIKNTIRQKHGRIDGIFHCASHSKSERIIQMDSTTFHDSISTKIHGAWMMDYITQDNVPDFFVCFSSMFSITGGIGESAYIVANSYLDAYAQYRSEVAGKTIAINWPIWERTKAYKKREEQSARFDLFYPMDDDIAMQSLKYCLQTDLTNAAIGKINFQSNAFKLARYLPFEFSDNILNYNPLSIEQSLRPINQKRVNSESISNTIENIWISELGMQKLDYNDDVFSLGGDSLIISNIANRINEEVGFPIKIQDIFEYPTIKKLSKYINDNYAKSSVIPSIQAANNNEYYPLTKPQLNLFVSHKLNPTSNMYNLNAAFIMKGHLDVDKLEKAFNQLIHRHEILRTSFHIKDNEIIQKVHSEFLFNINRFKIKKKDIDKFVKDNIKPFKLEEPILLRVFLAEVDMNEWLLLYDMHHIISDGISSEIFISDLIKLYNNDNLPQLTIQYKDYAVWQKKIYDMNILNEQEKYWIDMYKDGVPKLNHTNNRAGNIITYHFDIKNEMVHQIKDYIKNQEISLSSFLLAGYAILYSRWIKEQDFVIGLPISGRPNTALNSVMGMFANVLPLRIKIDCEKTIIQYLDEIKKSVIRSISNQDYYTCDLLAKLNISAKGNESIMYRTTFSMQNWKRENNVLSELSIERHHINKEQIQNDIMIHIDDSNNRIRVGIEYRESFIKDNTFDSFEKDYLDILHYIICLPDHQMDKLFQ